MSAITQEQVLKLLPTIKILARKYKGTHRIELEDLTQEGMLGVLESIPRFDPERSSDWRTLAIFYAKNRMREFHRSNNTVVPLSANRFRWMWRLNRIRDLLELTDLDHQDRQEVLKVFDSEPEKRLPIDLAAAIRKAKQTLADLAESAKFYTYERAVEMVMEAEAAAPTELVPSEAAEFLPDPTAYAEAASLMGILTPLQQQIWLGRALGFGYEQLGELLAEAGFHPKGGGPWTKQNIYGQHQTIMKKVKEHLNRKQRK